MRSLTTSIEIRVITVIPARAIRNIDTLLNVPEHEHAYYITTRIGIGIVFKPLMRLVVALVKLLIFQSHWSTVDPASGNRVYSTGSYIIPN